MIFTPTSWLIPRPTYKGFREIFDKHFKFERGFIITGQEFFKGTGRWPVAFTIWRYNHRNNTNIVKLLDLTELSGGAFSIIPWNDKLETINTEVKKIIRGAKEILFDDSRGEIRDLLPLMPNPNNNNLEKQPRYNIYRNIRPDEVAKQIISGFPLKDDRHQRIKAPHGFVDGTYIGFMDDVTPVRIYNDTFKRMSNKSDRIWARLDSDIKGVNRSKLFNGPTDNRSYCAYDLTSAKALLSWFCITKAINGVYPVWANQFDIWPPIIKERFQVEYFSLCFAFALSENRCVVTKFEKDNPVQGAPEVFVDNPLCPTNPDAFWFTMLDSEVKDPLAKSLVDAIKSLYKYWNFEYCKGQFLENVGLNDEPYFQFFNYPDFVTPYSGLIQIRKYAEINGKTDILEKFEPIKQSSKQVKERIYDLLVNEFKYFE